jgi:hypothetical protein
MEFVVRCTPSWLAMDVEKPTPLLFTSAALAVGARVVKLGIGERDGLAEFVKLLLVAVVIPDIPVVGFFLLGLRNWMAL